MGGGVGKHERGQLPGGQRPEMTLDGGSKISGWLGDSHEFGADADVSGGRWRGGLDPSELAEEQEFGTELPFGRLREARGQALELALEPVPVAFSKEPGFGVGTVSRDGDTGCAVGLQAKDVASGARVEHEAKRNASGLEFDRRFGCAGFGR